MPKRFLIAVAFLLLCSQAFAISAQEAVNFATKQNNFLYSGEAAEVYPNVRIEHKGDDYWVITILSGGDLKGFVPVLDKAVPELPEGSIARRELIKTAYVLRYERELNESSSLQGLWLFDAKNAKFFSDLGQDLKNEKIDLTTVKTSLGGFPILQDDLDDLQSMLDQMFPLAEDISAQVFDTTSFENGFLAEPDTNRLQLFKKTFLDSFELIGQLEQMRTAYLGELDRLRQAIALTDLPLDTKQGLNSLANVPNSLQQFGSKATIAVDLEEKLVAIFDNALVNVDGLSADLSTREERSEAFRELYGSDSEILEETGQGSLSQLMGVLLDEDYFFKWENQAELSSAKQDWEKAVSYYNSGSFPQAGQYAKKAKNSTLNVYALGLREDPVVFNPEEIYFWIVLLIIVLIIIYVLRNREKIFGLFSQEEEEVELHEWEK